MRHPPVPEGKWDFMGPLDVIIPGDLWVSENMSPAWMEVGGLVGHCVGEFGGLIVIRRPKQDKEWVNPWD